MARLGHGVRHTAGSLVHLVIWRVTGSLGFNFPRPRVRGSHDFPFFLLCSFDFVIFLVHHSLQVQTLESKQRLVLRHDTVVRISA